MVHFPPRYVVTHSGFHSCRSTVAEFSFCRFQSSFPFNSTTVATVPSPTLKRAARSALVLDEGVSKDRARPFSRKHRRYWIPVTGGMVLIGVINVIVGFCTYTRPSDVHERIIPDVPYARGSGSVPSAAPAASGCAPAITARIEAEMPGSTVTTCAPDRVTVVRGQHKIELEVAGDEIRGVAETLALPEIPAAVMRAFAVAYPRTIPSGAIKRTQRGAEPTYELGFPHGAAHTVAILRGDGTVIELR